MNFRAFFRLNSADRVVALLLCGIVAVFAYFRYTNESYTRELKAENIYCKSENKYKDELLNECNQNYRITLKQWISKQDSQMVMLNKTLDNAIKKANTNIKRTNKILNNE